MLSDVIKSPDFAKVMQSSIQDILFFLFEQEQNFGILCKVEEISFDPPLPPDIHAEFRPMTLFFLAGYTFESSVIEDGYLSFEAGFGAENIGSFVHVPLLSIVQIIIDENPIFINLSQVRNIDETQKGEMKPEGIKNSMSAFLSNPENQKFIKKK